jgi:transcriptional regulator GlxA family with amidase domain
MTNLSPAAQAVQDAAWTTYDDDALYFFTAEQHAGKIAAAALCAAAYWLAYETQLDDPMMTTTHVVDADRLDAIADELEQQS